MDDDHLIHIFTDVTPIKEAQILLEKTVEELKRSNSNLEAFAYAASHDLKEPIRKINIFSSRIKDALRDHLGGEEKRYFERLEVSAKRMNFLIDDLLSYAQVSAHPRSVEKIDLNELIQTVLETLDLEIEEKNAKITVSKLFVIKGDQRQWEQAFQNLIGNALKYKKPGIAPDIRISYGIVKAKDIKTIPDEGQKFNAITVSDNGIGIELVNIDKIFNVFTRLHNNDLYQGSGVGLSIVRKVIENHKGFINVESKPGVGTKFIIYLPHFVVEED